MAPAKLPKRAPSGDTQDPVQNLNEAKFESAGRSAGKGYEGQKVPQGPKPRKIQSNEKVTKK